MPFVTFAERRGMEKGLEEGLRQGKQEAISAVLEVRFPERATALLPEVRKVDALDRLDRLLALAKTADLAAVEQALLAPTA